MQQEVVIVAGGKGTRMGGDVPKQFMLLDGKPLVMHTIEQFRKFSDKIGIFLVLPSAQIDYWKALCKQYAFDIPHTIVEGGSERFFSVRNGLQHTSRQAVIAIHDAVRPFVSIDTLERCFAVAEEKGNAVPYVKVSSSLRKITDENGKNCAVDRTLYREIQTPQVFKGEVIHHAFEQEYSPLFTDDASVAEAAGEHINLVEGNIENIKITTPIDFLVAEKLLQNR